MKITVWAKHVAGDAGKLCEAIGVSPDDTATYEDTPENLLNVAAGIEGSQIRQEVYYENLVKTIRAQVEAETPIVIPEEPVELP